MVCKYSVNIVFKMNMHSIKILPLLPLPLPSTPQQHTLTPIAIKARFPRGLEGPKIIKQMEIYAYEHIPNTLTQALNRVNAKGKQTKSN